ncbi:MAG: hypothetical protein ACI4KM_09595 [Oscillospiraceae bacterium]
MLGKPKYKLGERVKFKCNGAWLVGVVEIIDSYGTFEQNEEVSYDILSELNGEPCLYKHIRESGVFPVDESEGSL